MQGSQQQLNVPSGDVQTFKVRHAVTGTVYATRDSVAECETWVRRHPRVPYLVIERADECLSFDAHAARGTLWNVPGRPNPRRKPAIQDSLF